MKKAIRDRLRVIRETRRDTTKCIFCGTSPTTDEHVFSRWTHKYMLPRTNEKAKSYVALEHVDRVVGASLKLPGPARDWQIKCVCACCNNNWMSQLDSEVEPLMEPLIRGRLTRLFEKDCRKIATWAVLKSMIVHNRIPQRAALKYLKEAKAPPKGWGVWIANYQRRQWKAEWLSWPFSIRENAERYAPRRAAYNSYVTVQIIEKLFIQVANVSYEDFATRFRFRREDRSILAGDVILLWPYTGRSIVWPPKPLNDSAIVASTAAIRAIRKNDATARRLARSCT